MALNLEVLDIPDYHILLVSPDIPCHPETKNIRFLFLNTNNKKLKVTEARRPASSSLQAFTSESAGLSLFFKLHESFDKRRKTERPQIWIRLLASSVGRMSLLHLGVPEL